jgi:hypothetical protein
MFQLTFGKTTACNIIQLTDHNLTDCEMNMTQILTAGNQAILMMML